MNVNVEFLNECLSLIKKILLTTHSYSILILLLLLLLLINRDCEEAYTMSHQITLFLAILLLLLFFSDECIASNRRIYPMGDIQFNLPECHLLSNSIVIENLFANLEIKSNLLDPQLELSLSLQPRQRVCRICQTDPSHCNFTTDNQTLSLSLDTSYNLKVILLKSPESESTSSKTYALRELGGESLLELDRPCGETLRMVVLSIFNIRSPVLTRDFLLIAYDHSHPDRETLKCQSPWTTNKTDLSCSISPIYHYIEYPFTNCLSPALSPRGGGDRQRSNLSVSEYYRRLRDGERLEGGEMKFCGESWSSIMERSRMDLFCDPELILYIKLKGWYEAAVIAISAWENGRTNEPRLWLLMDSLSKTCAHRESRVALENTIFFEMVSDFIITNNNRTTDERLCLEVIERGNVTLPFYVTHYRSWYYQLFHYIIEPSEGMQMKAIFLILFFCLLIIISLIATALVIYQIYFRKSSLSNDYQPLY